MQKWTGEDVRIAAEQESLVFLGSVLLGEEPEFQRFSAWLNEGKQAGMTFLENHEGLRRDPRGLLAGAQSALILGLPYFDGDRLHDEVSSPRVAMYARFRDYHKILRQRGERILHHLQQKDDQLFGRVTVDSAPLLERALAKKTSRGFIGKNTLYIHPEWGSYLLLMEIIINQSIEEKSRFAIDPTKRNAEGGCGSCRRCEVHCPTGALDGYQLDARKCLSYYTIENRGTIPLPYWPYLKKYIFGCDICQLVCPYNRKIPLTKLPRHQHEIDLLRLVTMTQQEYEEWFGGTPLTRAKRSGLRRNALIAMVVTSDLQLASALDFLVDDKDPLLRATLEQIPFFLKR